MAVKQHHPRDLTRRSVLVTGAIGMLAGASMSGRSAAADGAAWARVPVIREMIGEQKPRADGLLLELPLVWEDGAAVPVRVAAEQGPSLSHGVRAIHLFATRNPFPEIASFRFTPRSGRAEVSTRIRLNETQTVFAVAELGNGERSLASADTRITRSGCLLRSSAVQDEDEMKSRVRVVRGSRSASPAEVVTLITHPMETGLRQGPDGLVRPKRLIQSLTADVAGERIFEAEFYRAVATDPYLRFFIAPEVSGELVLTWTEDSGRSTRATAAIV